MKKIFWIGFVLVVIPACLIVMTNVDVGQIDVNDQVAKPDQPDQSSFMAIGLMEVVRGIQSAINQNTGTFIMQSDQLVVFAWPHGSRYGFVSFGMDGQPVQDWLAQFTGGQKVDSLTMADLVNYLKDRGFRFTTPDQIPHTFIEVFGTYTASYIVKTMSIQPSVILVPLGVFGDPQMMIPTPVDL